jgi:hypothetical protein
MLFCQSSGMFFQALGELLCIGGKVLQQNASTGQPDLYAFAVADRA